MVLLAMQRHFNKAAAQDAFLQDGLVGNVREEIFYQTLYPIYQLMINDPVYSNSEIDITKQFQELRQICSEVQMKHETDDYIVRLGRNELINNLQKLLENTMDAKNGNIFMESDDLFALSNLTDVIRGDAKIYREFMRTPIIADALYQVADNIDRAQSKLWIAGIRRDYAYIQSIHDRRV